MESEVTNTIVFIALIKSTDLSHAGASAARHVSITDLVSPFSPPFFHSFVAHYVPHFFTLPLSLPFPFHQTLSMPT